MLHGDLFIDCVHIIFLEISPPDYASAPPPSNPVYGTAPTGATTEYNTGVPPSYTGAPIQGYQQYPSTYHPQYGGAKETHVIMTQVCVWVCVCACLCVCVCVCAYVCVGLFVIGWVDG